MTGSRLAALLDQATPGPWEAWESESHSDELGRWVFLGVDGAKARGSVPVVYEYENEVLDSAPNAADARLIALAPDMARLLVDMAASLQAMRSLIVIDEDGAAEAIRMEDWGPVWVEGSELLARFAALDEKAGGA